MAILSHYFLYYTSFTIDKKVFLWYIYTSKLSLFIGISECLHKRGNVTAVVAYANSRNSEYYSAVVVLSTWAPVTGSTLHKENSHGQEG